MSGVYLFYELATPTTEQGTQFPENIEINDYGTMEWDSNVPQGCKIFYPADYVLFVDSLGQRADINWDASEVVSQSELNASETQRDNIDTQLKNAIGGTLRHCLAIQEAGVNFEDTDFVDLGTLTWTYSSDIQRFNATTSIENIKVVNNSTAIKGLCTQYDIIGSDYTATTDKSLGVNTSGLVRIKDTTYTDATTFKNAMKGVLLAYEKA